MVDVDMSRARQVLFVDAYDSFSQSIVALLRQLLHVQVVVTRIDSWGSPDGGTTEVAAFVRQFAAVVIGPGPGDPRNRRDVGIIPQLWSIAEASRIPVLGICLGFQSLCLTYGASISRLPEPCHGRPTEILHCNQDIFAGVGAIVATNYHSLEAQLCLTPGTSRQARPSSSDSGVSPASSGSCSPRATDLQPLAWSTQGTLMAARHVYLPFWGVQFHPESCKSSSSCFQIVLSWWRLAMESSTAPIGALTLLPRSENTMAVTNVPNEIIESTDGPNETKLWSKLRSLTESSGSRVYSATIPYAEQDKQIASFCQQMSSSRQTIMLESTKKGRFSVYALPSRGTFRLEYYVGGRNPRLARLSSSSSRNGEEEHLAFQCLDTSAVFRDLYRTVLQNRATGGSVESPFWGGFMGYFSYEVGLDMLGLNENKEANSCRGADINLLWTERSIVIDKLQKTVHIQSIRKDDADWIKTTERALSQQPIDPSPHDFNLERLNTLLETIKVVLPCEASYKQNIHECQEHLRAGSSYELCLTSAAEVSLQSTDPDDDWLLYQNLQRRNPAPSSAYLRLGRTTVLSSSPEQFLTWNRLGQIDMVPMKGTVSKSDPSMNFERAASILSSPKESAENLMIADLIRHDLFSAVGHSETASVEVEKLCEVIEHETVYQLVSHIRARAPVDDPSSDRSVLTSSDARLQRVIYYGHRALQRCIPPGSMTGAPKKRSCEILRDLEKKPRGVYSGVLGYLDVGGGGGFNVCIRTAFSHRARTGRRSFRIRRGGMWELEVPSPS